MVNALEREQSVYGRPKTKILLLVLDGITGLQDSLARHAATHSQVRGVSHCCFLPGTGTNVRTVLTDEINRSCLGEAPVAWAGSGDACQCLSRQSNCVCISVLKMARLCGRNGAIPKHQ